MSHAAANCMSETDRGLPADPLQSVLLPVWRGRTEVLRPIGPPLSDDPVQLALSTPDLALIRVNPDASEALLQRLLKMSEQAGVRVRMTGPPEWLAKCQTEAADKAAAAAMKVSQRREERGRLVQRIQQLQESASRSQTVGFWARLFGRRPSPSNATAGVAQLQETLDHVGRELVELETASADLERTRRQFSADTADPPSAVLVAWHANDMTGAEFLAAAADASRWVLVGMFDSNGGPTGGNAFDHLWSIMTDRPWAREGDRLRCRLRPIAMEERQNLVVEPLANATEIELRFLHDGAVPELVEITFPPTTTLAAAKEFVAIELGEWPIDLEAGDLEWTEAPDRVVACCGCQEQHTRIEHGPAAGVHELIADRPAGNGHGPLPWFTCGFSFDRAAGWDRGRAEEWVGRLPIDRARARTMHVGAGSANHP